MTTVYQDSACYASGGSDVLESPYDCHSNHTEHGLLATIELQGGRFRFHKPIEAGKVRPGGGQRGKVHTMSNGSRLRLMQKFASLDFAELERQGVSFFWVTLTTPREYWSQVGGVYKALRRFHDRLVYAQGDKGFKGALVRRELGGKNGALHYHLCIVGGEGINVAWLRKNWGECLGYQGEKTLQVHVEEITEAGRVAKYMSKYCAKAGFEGKEGVRESAKSAQRSFSDSPDPRETGEAGSASLTEAHNVGNPDSAYTGGRWWYVWGAETLPWAEIVTIEGLDAVQIAKRFKRIFRRWRQQVAMQRMDRQINSQGFSVRHFAPKAFRKFDAFFQRLKRDRGGGCTLLVSPDLLERFLDAAAYGEMCHREGLCSA